MKKTTALMTTLIALASFAYSKNALAEVQMEGRGEVPYESGVFSSNPDPETHQKAVIEAEKAAIDRYASSFASAKYALFRKISPDVYGQIDQYVIDSVILDEGFNKDTQSYHIIIRASINDAKLEALLNDQGMINNTTISTGKSTTVSYLFVAREADSSKSFDARHTEMKNGQSSTNATQAQGISGGTAKYAENTESTQISTTGGNTLRKADEVSYRVTSPDNLNTSMSEVLTSKNFQVFDYSDIVNQCGGPDPRTINAGYSKSDELSRDVRGKVFAAAKQCEISSFAFGILDVGVPDVDPVTGNKRVFVSVRSQIMDLTGRLPRIVASVGPVQYAGLGPDQKVATNNALNLAAAEAAKTIGDQLNAKGMR
ncbi:MAG: hypothetical protein WCD70_12460 [Alphaproteobacteria bacterium]